MIGLAQMAWKLAQERTCASRFDAPLPRVNYLNPSGPSAAYYAICDRIARGEKP